MEVDAEASCSPISMLACGDVVLGSPVELAFDGTDGGLTDKDGEDIGFTMVDPPSARLAVDGEPSNPDVPGYEPSLLDVADDALTITATQGIQYADNDQSSDTNSLINGLGLGLDATAGETTVSTTVQAPDFDASSNSEKGGLWFGLDEDNLVNLSVQNQNNANVRVQVQREVGGTVATATDEFNSPTFPEGTDVKLSLVLDQAAGTAIGFYQVGDGPQQQVGDPLPVPAALFDGALLSDGETGPASFAGIYATARREATSTVQLSFADFAVTNEAPTGDNTLPEVILTGDRTLFEGQETTIPVSTFDEDDDEVSVSIDGQPAGLTYADGEITGTLAQETVADSPYTVTVTGDDGTDSVEESFQITVLDDVAIDVNFQSLEAPTPDGYLPDSGLAYGDRGDGLSYGWVVPGTETGLDMSSNGRDRDRAGTDQLLDTLMHMQYGDISEVYDGNANCTTNQCDDGAWEIAVPNGLYEVTVSVGDQPGGQDVYDSLHALNIESGVGIREFQASGAQEYLEGTAQAGVVDGRLSIDADGGANTKINFVRIRSLGMQPFVTTTVPANRATDVELETSISASVNVPGTGVGVDPDRDTSLTDEAVKLFEITDTGEDEVEANRGSTGGNDTIAISPTAPLKPDTTYRYVIDGVFDEAGNTFGRFESVFTTGEGDTGPEPGAFDPVEGVDFEKVLLPTASGNENGKYFASLVVHQDYLWATTIGQGMYRYEILPDGTLGEAQDLGVLAGRAAVGLVFDENNPDLAWVTHATANLSNESARTGSKVSVVDFSDVASPEVTDVFVNLPRSQKDHLSNSLTYGPTGDGGDDWMYFLQGSNQAAGDVDGAWGNRGETQLTAALLRFDPQDALAQVAADGPIDVATEEVGGSYDPYADDAPLDIYATGIRNAYDLLWHSNGHIYVPTNGTAGGANSPGVDIDGDTATMVSNQGTAQTGYGDGTDVSQQCATRRIDGEPYSGGSVPAITNHPTQRDFLFDVEESGFYGHPNPTRCEWALNNAGNPEGAGAGGSKYPSSVEPDPNYRGWAYDFEFNKSPNGVIEYQSNTFGGELKGRMMVIRFSANDDILTMQVDDDGTVLGAQSGTEVDDSMTGYVDPLDLTEDTEVNEGNLYVNQYNRGGEPQQLYLLRVPDGQGASSIDVDTAQVTMSATLNNEQPTDTATVTVSNGSDEAAEVAADVTGADAGQFSVSGPGAVPAGGEATVEVTFDPSGTPGTRTATIGLTTADGGSADVNLRALAFAGQEGGEEPTLDQVVDALDLPVDVGWTNLAGGTEPVAKGDEVLEPIFERAGDGPVTMTPVAAFAPQESLPFGWYAAADGAVTTNQVGAIANGQLQTLRPELGDGSTTFDPGTDPFGLYYFSNTFDRTGYTEDTRNDSGGLHRARVYPLPGDSFLVAFEDAANGDYQDYVFVVDNAVAAGSDPEPEPETPIDGPVSVNFQSETAPVPDGSVRDFGEAYGARTGADQGADLSYGWVDVDSGDPLSLVGNGRDRDLNDEQRLDTLMHMDLPPVSDGGVERAGSWEIAAPDGEYEVTVSVGDPQSGDAPESHTINVEGQNAIDAFPNSSAPDGSDERHEQATVTVEVTDGRLTIDQDGGTNTKVNYVAIEPVEEEPPAPADSISVNFQSETAPVPDGSVRDFGEAYGARTGADQGADLSYGWVDVDNGDPLALVGNGRDRDLNDEQRLDTLMHMDLPPESDGGVDRAGSWEIAVPDGQYEVAVSVGDPAKGSAPESHTINVEGQNAIDAFPNSSAPNGSDERHEQATVTVEVTDGRLTIDQDGGTNTKVNYVDITPAGAAGDQTVAQINFQTADATAPQGWDPDSGELFDATRGYGWVRTEGGAAKTEDVRARGTDSDPLTDTLALVDDVEVDGVVDGEWEYAIADGEYTVEISVGDPDYFDSDHGISAEGVSVIDSFVPTAAGDYGTGSATVEVSDGALTLASTGSNSKLQWVRISTTETGDVVPPQVSISLDGDGGDGSYTGPVTVTVDATDRTLEFVEYTIDGGDLLRYTEPFEVSGNGAHEVVVTATDGAGNVTERSEQFTITELGAGDLTMTNPEAAPFDDRLVMSRIQSTASDPMTSSTGTVVLGNDGTEPIEVSALDIADPGDFELVGADTLPATIPVGGELPVEVEFVGTGSGRNTSFESELVVRHDGSDGPASVVELAAIWQTQSEGGNEPSVAQIAETYGLGTTIVGSGEQINNQGRLEAIGDEVLSKTWKRLDTTEPMTVRQLGAFHSCCSNTAAFGWHPVGNKGSWTQVLRHDGQWAQTLLPRINNSDSDPAFATFTPGPATFSWRIDPESSDWTTNNTSPDNCGSGNDGCQLGHHLRVFPAEDRDGEAIPGSYLAIMDYSGINYDFNDNVYLVTNAAPAD